jgi:hypothetical protein
MGKADGESGGPTEVTGSRAAGFSNGQTRLLGSTFSSDCVRCGGASRADVIRTDVIANNVSEPGMFAQHNKRPATSPRYGPKFSDGDHILLFFRYQMGQTFEVGPWSIQTSA